MAQEQYELHQAPCPKVIDEASQSQSLCNRHYENNRDYQNIRKAEKEKRRGNHQVSQIITFAFKNGKNYG